VRSCDGFERVSVIVEVEVRGGGMRVDMREEKRRTAVE
jgi:hypothetical protein